MSLIVMSMSRVNVVINAGTLWLFVGTPENDDAIRILCFSPVVGLIGHIPLPGAGSQAVYVAGWIDGEVHVVGGQNGTKWQQLLDFGKNGSLRCHLTNPYNTSHRPPTRGNPPAVPFHTEKSQAPARNSLQSTGSGRPEATPIARPKRSRWFLSGPSLFSLSGRRR